jgi:hypothetical protein
MVAGRTGTAGSVGYRSWSDGRAWLTVRATTSWPGGRLFGGLGRDVVPVDLGDAGAGYLSGDGRRVAVHAAGLDIAVAGSIATDELRREAASLGVVGEAVPAGWDEASTATLAEAVGAAPDLLVPAGHAGFGPPAVRIDGSQVELRYDGAGDRAFTVVRGAADGLTPPLEPDVSAVTVRGHPGRWQAATGDLEWVEAGHVRAVRSETLSLDELLAVARSLERP